MVDSGSDYEEFETNIQVEDKSIQCSVESPFLNQVLVTNNSTVIPKLYTSEW